jgi:hypothetical protein
MCRKPLWKEGTLYVPCKKQKKRMFQADRATLVSGSLYIERNPPVAASRYRQDTKSGQDKHQASLTAA